MKYLTLALLLVISGSVKSQKDAFYSFDANWKGTAVDKAKYLVHSRQLNDTCWQFDYYNFKGPLIKTEQFRDNQGQVVNGNVRYYNEKGFLDSAGHYHDCKKDGEFIKMTGDTLKWKWKYIYREDSLLEVIDLDKLKKDTSLKYKDEKESEFPGGLSGWARYLKKNLKYPDRAVNFNSQGQVHIRFIVDAEGNVEDPHISASVEYSIDEEALRIIRNSGKWEPAFQNGHNVKSYKMQPLNFRLE